jgi:hypothetical protein
MEPPEEHNALAVKVARLYHYHGLITVRIARQLAGLVIASVAGIDRLFATLHVGAHPVFSEMAPAQSEMACNG